MIHTYRRECMYCSQVRTYFPNNDCMQKGDCFNQDPDKRCFFIKKTCFCPIYLAQFSKGPAAKTFRITNLLDFDLKTSACFL